MRYIATLIAALCVSSSAHACQSDNNGRTICGEVRQLTQTLKSSDGHIVAHPAGCPWRLFCGCGVSVRVFGHPVRELFLASNWRKFPSAVASAGMVAWRRGHVFYIESVNHDGTVMAYDPNSGGHATRIHSVSLRGYKVVNPKAVLSSSL